MATDPVTLELVKNAVESVVDEMALTMMRTAYSSNLKSSNDLSSAYCSLDGELLAQGFTLPMQLGSIPDAMATVIAKFGGTFEPGDVVILNDPYEGGTHLPDIFLIKPLFLDGEHVAYCATIAHHTDIGGRVAGGNASDSTEIYQEGLRLPPIKLYDAGRPNQARLRDHRQERPGAGEPARRSARAALGDPHRRARLRRAGRALGQGDRC